MSTSEGPVPDGTGPAAPDDAGATPGAAGRADGAETPGGAGRADGGGADAETVDARGLRCPLPVIRLAARAKELPAGTEVSVLSTDPAAEHDVPAWARMRGHETVSVTESDGVWTLTVRLRRPRRSDT